MQTIHNSYVFLPPAGAAAYRANDSFTAAYVCVSQMAAHYADVKLGLPVSKMVVVPNGVDLSRIEGAGADARASLRRELGIEDDDFVFLNTCSLHAIKCQATLVRAFAEVVRRFPEAKLVLVGRAFYQGYLAKVQQAIARYGLQKSVLLAGHRDDTARFYAAADAFVLPSLCEGWSLALAEAIAAGLAGGRHQRRVRARLAAAAWRPAGPPAVRRHHEPGLSQSAEVHRQGGPAVRRGRGRRDGGSLRESFASASARGVPQVAGLPRGVQALRAVVLVVVARRTSERGEVLGGPRAWDWSAFRPFQLRRGRPSPWDQPKRGRLKGMEVVNKLRVLLTFGTRPEAIKMAPVVHECRRQGDRIRADRLPHRPAPRDARPGDASISASRSIATST